MQGLSGGVVSGITKLLPFRAARAFIGLCGCASVGSSGCPHGEILEHPEELEKIRRISETRGLG